VELGKVREIGADAGPVSAFARNAELMDISVIICSYNRCERLRRVLEDIKKLTPPENTSYEVLVVDNNSEDGTRAVVEAAAREGSGVVKYSFERRQGKSFALNRGVSQATGGILAFTDDDVEIDRAWLVEITRAFALHHCLGVGGRIIPAWQQGKPWWYEEEGPYRLLSAIVRLDLGEEACEMRTPPFGANMAFRRAAFEKYGLFREDLGPNPQNQIRGEDTEFCRRLMGGREKLMYIPTMIVYHPVEEKRATRRYFLGWYFGYGRALVRTEGIPEGAIRYFGVPRYLFRGVFELGARWVRCLRPKRRFFHKLQLYLIAGQIVESRASTTRGRQVP
jgi:glycosyltransferase involved in cell wall biosynthesis